MDGKRSLEEFSRWKVDILKDFLRKRGLKYYGMKKQELAALAFGAEHLDIPLKPTAKEEKATKAMDYQKLLSPEEGVILHDPFSDLCDGWVGETAGMRLWPAVMQIDITQYLLTLHDRDIGKRLLSDYKEGKAYSYFDSKWLKEVFFHPVNETSQWCYLKSECTPSDSLANPNHKIWVMVKKMSGEVVKAYCTCFAGLGSTCNHVAAILFKVEDAWRRGLVHQSCTTQQCGWNKYSGKTVLETIRVDDMNLKKPHLKKKGKGKTINPLRRKLFNPIGHSTSMRRKTSTLKTILSGMYPSCNEACAFEYVKLPLPKVEHPAADFNLECEVEVETTELVPPALTKLPVNDLNPDVFFQNLPQFTAGQVASLEAATRGQSDNEEWAIQRVGRITGSIIHSVKTKVATLKNESSNRSKDTYSLVKQILGETTISSHIPALKYGSQMEIEARKCYLQFQKKAGHKNVRVRECGLFTLPAKMYIGASPDGIVSCDCCGSGVLEIKCPLSLAHEDPTIVGTSYLKKVNGKFQLKENHSHYSQCLTEMAVTNSKWCDFVVFSHKGLHVERLYFNQKIWESIVSASDYFFQNEVVPALVVKILLANADTPSKPSDTPIETPIQSTPATVSPEISETPSNPEFGESQHPLPARTSFRRKRKVKVKKESQPLYMCGTCNHECLYPDQITNADDNTVQCDHCKSWFHWGCAGYEGNSGDWWCLGCELIQDSDMN